MSSQNALNNQVYDNDFTVNRRDAGPSDVGVVCRHLDGTNVNNNAFLIAATTAGGGDPGVRMAIDAVQEYPFGIQHATNDLVIGVSPGTPSSTGVAWRMTPAGERTMPFQPCFDARLSVSTGGVTGNGATYVFGNNGGGTSVVDLDQGSNLNIVGGNITFTNPVPGTYLFTQTYRVSSIVALMTSLNMSLLINGVNPSFGTYINPASSAVSIGSVIILSIPTQIYFASAGNTVVSTLTISGNIADSAVVDGGALGSGSDSHFRGVLLC